MFFAVCTTMIIICGILAISLTKDNDKKKTNDKK